MELVVNENVIRKNWLKSYKVLFLYKCICCSICFVMGWLLENRGESSGDIYRNGIVVLLSIVPLYFCYRCTYKKPGTKFLTFSLIMSVLAIVREVMDLSEIDLLSFAVVLLGFVVFIYFFKESIKIRTLNKELRTLSKKPIG